MRPRDIFFNAHHSPIGAFASFTLGFPGQSGGLGLELGGPANQNVYIGVESDQRGLFEALPFFRGESDERKRYDVEAEEAGEGETRVQAFARERISREFGAGIDTWRAGDMTFRILSPVCSLPDPALGDTEELKAAVAPAVCAELTLDNRRGSRPRKAFFGYQGSDPYCAMRRIDDTAPELVGIGQGRLTAVCGRDPALVSGLGFTIEDVVAPRIPENRVFGLGSVGALVGEAAAGELKTFRFAICFFREGTATAGMDTVYYYTRFFDRIEEVASFALASFDGIVERARQGNAMVEQSSLSPDQQFMLAHAIRGYYGSTEFLARDDKPFWVVNEGEYRMMNTFDLTVDQLFYEMKMNPWTVRNELEMFIERYSYRDMVRFPGDQTEYPGGLSFTHDMGMANCMSRPSYSAYELFRLDGCFSHMTHEQLVNWALCGAVYYRQTGDAGWLTRRLEIFEECLQSMCNRDHPDPDKRNGIMALDSSRTMGGAEITTYDSLDVSLGQARNNVYMAVKCWAAYVALEKLFMESDRAGRAAQAREQAVRCSRTLLGKMTAGGYIPAVIDEGNDSRIIPAIEGLVFPRFTGCEEALAFDGPYGEFIGALKRHLETVLVKGVCLFEDGGWKISSTSDNSWLSKIYLSQYVARAILGVYDPAASAAADSSHVGWLLDAENAYFAWSDQMVAGKARGSKYYPRGVTAILWLGSETL
jgi:hypothetical protein